MKSFEKIAIVGTGNVAWHLCKGFLNQKVDIIGVFGRNKEALNRFHEEFDVETYTDYSYTRKADVAICAISDKYLVDFILEKDFNIPIAYTSGSVGLSNFNSESIGVFYPLQTFTKQSKINLFEVPFFIEAKNEILSQQLFDLAWKLSRKVEFANSEKRSELHLAAVFANNFTNHMFSIASSYLEEKGMDLSYLLPLIEESIKKLKTNNPSEIQTGPAKRGDKNIIAQHLRKLSGKEQEIYALISAHIEEKQNEKL